jgi:putative ABC transport system permease protein
MAAVGLTGMVSYSVSRRRTEIGIRAALGAASGSLIWLILRDVFLITGGGLVFGILLSFAGGRLITKLLYEVTPSDPMTLIIALSTLTLTAAVAGYIPARRVARVDPMQCLRSE